MNDSQIERVRSHKFLGVEIEDDLTFENHCIALAQKVSKIIGLLKYISPYLKSDHKKTYYNAIIKPVLLYGANIWTSTSKENLNNILRLQKRAARIILDAEPRSRTLPLFNTLNWLPFYQEAYVNRCTLILKRTLNKVPEYRKSLLQLNSDVHSRNTRYSNLNLRCPIYNNSTEGGRTFTVRSIKDWNSLEIALKNSKDTKSFKKRLINTLLIRQKETTISASHFRFSVN